VQTCTVPCSLFSFLKILGLRLADKQQWPCHSAKFPCKLSNNSINPSLAVPLQQLFSLQQSSPQQFPFSQNCPPLKSLMSSFSESFIPSGKQRGGATVLREGCDIEEKQLSWILLSHSLLWLGLCQIPAYRLFDINILGKAAAMHFTLALFCGWSCAKLSLQNIVYNYAFVLIDFSHPTPRNGGRKEGQWCKCLSNSGGLRTRSMDVWGRRRWMSQLKQSEWIHTSSTFLFFWGPEEIGWWAPHWWGQLFFLVYWF
jgi:hypothetical protein